MNNVISSRQLHELRLLQLSIVPLEYLQASSTLTVPCSERRKKYIVKRICMSTRAGHAYEATFSLATQMGLENGLLAT